MTDVWMPFYWGDYLKDTLHLSTEEHGAYLLLIAHYWCNGKIPRNLDILKNITRLSEKKLVNVVKFFKAEGAYYIHSRIEEELTKAIENKEKQRKRTQNATDARWKRNVSVTDNVTDSVTRSPSPSPSPKEKKTIQKKDAALPSGFAEFWQVYPKRKDKQLAVRAYTAALKKTTAQKILTSVIAYAAERSGQDERYTKAPASWLNAGAYENEIEKTNQQGGIEFEATKPFDIGSL